MFVTEPHLDKQIATVIDPHLLANFSGEITGNYTFPLGSPRKAGQISDIWFSVGESGKDDAETLSLSLDVLINGVSCLSTNPVIAHVSGEDSTNKTTVEDSDTGVTQAVMDGDNDLYSPGDVVTGKLTLTRTASPTTEMCNVCVVVPLLPT